MPYYLDQYVGSGVRGDEFRPTAYDDDPDAVAIDLRPDPSVVAGRALVRTSLVLPAQAGRIKIADLLNAKSAAMITNIQNRLGLNLSNTNVDLRGIMVDLLTNLARTDGTRWRPVVPSLIGARQARQYEIWLGDLVWSQPVIAGGATGSDDFTAADSTVVGHQFSWTETAGAWENLSNHARLTTNADVDDDFMRCSFDCLTTDMYTDMQLGNNVANYNECYSIARYAAAAQTFYFAAWYQDGGVGDSTIRKRIANSETRIGSHIANVPVNGDIIRIKCSGSSISHGRNGGTTETVTDTSITTGTLGGAGGYKSAGADYTIAKVTIGGISDGLVATFQRMNRLSPGLSPARMGGHRK